MAFGRLVVNYADGAQATVTLDKPTVRIGRASDNDIVLNDALVDPYHAQLLCDARGCQALDLSSGNGTTVDGLPLPAQQPRQLGEGSVIRIGGSRMTISLSGAAGRGAVTGRLRPRAQDEDLLTNLLGAPVAGNGRARVTPSLGSAQPAVNTAPTQAFTPPVAETLPPQLHISLSVADLTVDAGGTVMLTATVVNSSKIVDRIEVIVDGLPAAWVKIVPPSHSLFPGAKGESQIVIAPPRAPTSYARTYPFSVIAQSEQRLADRIVASAELTILPYSEFRLDPLDPKEQTAWMQANYTLQVSNRGNQDQSYEFQGANDQDAFIFRALPAPFVVGPGSTARARLTARLRFLRWFGKPQTHQFTVSATPADASAATQQVPGRFVQNPPLPPWALILIAALLLLTLFGCCGYLFGARILAFLRPTPTATAVATPPLSPLPVIAVGTAVATPAPTPDVQALQEQQASSQAATSGAQTEAFNQTATAIGGSNSATQAAFGQAVAQTQTSQANNFAQTQTAGAISVAQTQTSFAIVNDATSTAQADFNATATAAAGLQQQTQTAQAAVDVTATANAIAQQQTLTALPGANAATLTAIAQGFSQTQTANALFATQTALAQPPNTPTNTPTVTLTPTPIPDADEVFTFAPPGNFNGAGFATRNLIICTYDGITSGTGNVPGLPNCNPPDATGGGDIDSFGSQTQPVIFAPNVTRPFTPTNVLGDNRNGPIMVLTFPQRAVSSVIVDVALAPQTLGGTQDGPILIKAIQPTLALYRLRAYDGEGNLVKQQDSNLLPGPAIYRLIIGATAPQIRQVQIMMLEDNDGNFSFVRPLYVSRVAFNYSR